MALPKVAINIHITRVRRINCLGRLVFSLNNIKQNKITQIKLYKNQPMYKFKISLISQPVNKKNPRQDYNKITPVNMSILQIIHFLNNRAIFCNNEHC